MQQGTIFFFDQIAGYNKKWVASLQNHYIPGLCQANQCNALRITLSAAVLLHDKIQPHGTQSTSQKFYIWAATFFLLYHIHRVARQRSSSISQPFAERTLAQTVGYRIYFLGRACRIQKMNFYMNKLIFCKNLLFLIVPMLVNKDVLELSYDLKFTIQNHNSLYQPKHVDVSSSVDFLIVIFLMNLLVYFCPMSLFQAL